MPADGLIAGAVSARDQGRFLCDWQALTGAAAADRALVALSGGPDSSALLLLFAAAGRLFQSPVAATVDHGLRAASQAEAGAAAQLCRAIGVPHAILRGDLPDRAGGTANLSARARDLRYALLRTHAEVVGARWIVTAHHADDQLETMVMRLNRGSGVAGLAAIRSRADPIVRPLLGWTRAELAAVVAAAGVRTVDDPSNVDPRFDRARLRERLAGADWLNARAAARSAAALAQAEEAIAWTVGRLEPKRCAYGNGLAVLEAADLPAEVQRRLIERCLRHVDPGIVVRGGELTRLLDALRDGAAPTLGRVRCGHVTTRQAGAWSFGIAPPHRPTGRER